ncbi:hypothetical protein STENM223S_04274 [Streptomyces tendae]
MIQRFTPLSTQKSPSRTARVFMPAASEPASGSDRQYENIASPRARGAMYFFFSASEPERMTGSEPSLFTAGMREEDAQTRATSSITMTVASASAPAPPYSSGTCTACRSFAVSASRASRGKRASSSTAAACGAIFASASERTASRSMSCSSDGRYRSKSADPAKVSHAPEHCDDGHANYR